MSQMYIQTERYIFSFLAGACTGVTQVTDGEVAAEMNKRFQYAVPLSVVCKGVPNQSTRSLGTLMSRVSQQEIAARGATDGLEVAYEWKEGDDEWLLLMRQIGDSPMKCDDPIRKISVSSESRRVTLRPTPPHGLPAANLDAEQEEPVIPLLRVSEPAPPLPPAGQDGPFARTPSAPPPSVNVRPSRVCVPREPEGDL